MDMFDSRAMLAALEKMAPVPTYLRDTFVNGGNTHHTQTITVDVRNGTPDHAVYVRPTSEGYVVGDEGYSTKDLKTPYLKEKTVTQAARLLKRSPGETPYSKVTPQQRARRKLRDDLTRLRARFSRTKELQLAQALLYGKVTVQGYDQNDKAWSALYDYGRSANLDLTPLAGSDVWTDPGSNPAEDLDVWSDLVGEESYLVPDMLLLGKAAARAFKRHAKVREDLDTRNVTAGRLDLTKRKINGVRPLGTFEGFDVYEYTAAVRDPITGAKVPLIPDNRILLGSTSAEVRQDYGVILDDKAEDPEVEEFPKTWMEEDPSATWLMLASAPLLYPVDVNAFASVEVMP